jgi:CRISPR-associated protein Cmr6
MAKGTIRIKTTEGGEQQVWLEREGSEDIHLEGIASASPFENNHVCEYQKAGSKQLIITVGSRKITWTKPKKNQPAQQKKKVQLSPDQILRKTQKENPALDIPEPELTPVSDCPERTKLHGKNLYDLNRQSLRLPLDTQEKIQHLKTKRGVTIDNFGLALNKAVHFFKINTRNKNSIEYNHVDDGEAEPFLFRSAFDDKSKGKHNKEVRHFLVDFSFNTSSTEAAIKSLNERQQSILAEYDQQGWHTQKSCFTIDNRLVAGLGGASVFETSMTLHHVYGIPYLPGSSIKGLVRSWIIMNCFLPDKQHLEEGKRGKAAEKEAMSNLLFAYIFGTDTNGPGKKAHQGKVIFFDAYPQTSPVIEADVMNVHYPKYYSGQSGPVDYDSPTPIPFLTVGKCDANNEPLKFCFLLMAKEENKVNEVTDIQSADIDKLCKKKEGAWHDGLNGNSTVLEVVNYWLRSALTQHGIGAKTATGYGYFNPTT